MKKRNLIIALLMTTGLFAQSIVGVVGNGKEPLAGANVVVVGTDKGGVTDESGKYTIDVGAEGTYTLTASFIGYSSLTLDVKVGDIVGTANFDLEADVLAMSATPIPRTLHFSLMGARDLSVIATAPPNRQPVVTELHVFDEKIVRKRTRSSKGRDLSSASSSTRWLNASQLISRSVRFCILATLLVFKV